MTSAKSFPLEWDTGLKKEHFPTQASKPFTAKTRDRMADSMTIKQILDTNAIVENQTVRNTRKWKEIRNFWNVTRMKEYCHGNIENALWMFGNKRVTVDHFVSALVHEFKFDADIRMDTHLRWLYWSFEGGIDNEVDWRDILACCKIVTLFRMVRHRPAELLVQLFDIYARGGSDPFARPNDSWYLPKSDPCWLKVLHLPTITPFEAKMLTEMFEFAVDRLLLMEMDSEREEEQRAGERITRRMFARMLEAGESLVSYWQNLAWERLPTELRLLAIHEDEVNAEGHIQAVIFSVKLKQALTMYNSHIRKWAFKTWAIDTACGLRLKNFLDRKLFKKASRYVKFWRNYSAFQARKRKRILLAEVMGAYTMKARCFARIKLFNFVSRKVLYYAGYLDKSVKRISHGLGYVRNFVRLTELRAAFHRWWDEVKYVHNFEVAEFHCWSRRLRIISKTWCRWAHIRAVEKRQELIVMENKIMMERMLEQTEKQGKELAEQENKRTERLKKIAEEKQKEESEARLLLAKERARAFREEEKAILLAVQSDARKKRIKRDWKRMTKKFDKKWAKRRQDAIIRSQNIVLAYITSPDHKLAVEMKLAKLKKEFYAPPTPENPERERRLTSAKNIVFLYLQGKLTELGIDLKSSIPKFDKENRGYLTYKEFEAMILTLGVRLNPTQMSEVIRGVDADGDGFIELIELEASMAETKHLGVEGSPWKMYVDPAQDVICYHNFKTNERVLEYDMDDSKLKEILISNLYAEAETEVLKKLEIDKAADWEHIKEEYYVRRLQYMFRQWYTRRKRYRLAWKLEHAAERKTRESKRIVVKFIETRGAGAKTRAAFRRQLMLTWEKIWDVGTQRLFWYNHQSEESTWERPLLLWKYGDVPMPSPWVAQDVQLPGGSQTHSWAVHYWHVTAKRELPRKPDGLPLCQRCLRNLAVHRCTVCEFQYCFACHRATHASPFGFALKTQMTFEQRQDANFLEQLKSVSHAWELTQPVLCDVCPPKPISNDTKAILYAGVYCHQCKKNYCRPCSRRIHAGDEQRFHTLQEV